MSQADCVGVKLGGFIRLVKRHVRVRCLTDDIPTDFKVDIKDLEIGQSKRVADIQKDQSLRLLERTERGPCCYRKAVINHE